MAEQSLVVLLLLLRLVRLAERAVAVAGTAQETSLLLVLRGGRRQVREKRSEAAGCGSEPAPSYHARCK